MSYSVTSPCWNCIKKATCSDGPIINGTIQMIHMLGQDNGHQGAGSIVHTCVHFDAGATDASEPDHSANTD